VLVLTTAAVLLVAGCGGSGSSSTSDTTAARHVPLPTKAECRGHAHPLTGVHHPDRLKLIAPCRAIVGTVKGPSVSKDDDDETFNLAPDPAYAPLLNENNVKEGGLHIEIVPADQPGCRKGQLLVNPYVPDLGRCSGNHIPLPKAGQHVRAVGAYVLDTNNAWREIHPAWKVTVMPRAGG
jgi:hypothetical protein